MLKRFRLWLLRLIAGRDFMVGGIDYARPDSDRTVNGLTLRDGEQLVFSHRWEGGEVKLEDHPYIIRKPLLTQDEIDVLFGKKEFDPSMKKNP